MARLAPLLALALIAAACGGSRKAAAPPAPASPGPGKVVYQGTAWAVVLHAGKATAEHLVAGRWAPDRSGAVHVSVLGPKPGSHGNPATPQLAAEISAKRDLVDSALWVDGVEVLAKGGGLTPTQGTIYGAPDTPLQAGMHTAIAYGRTASNGTAVAWTFSTG